MSDSSAFNNHLKTFQTKFQSKCSIAAYAPGRVEILGNHTDYNEGFVLSVAIDKGTYFLLGPRDDNVVHIISGNKKEEIKSEIKLLYEEGKKKEVVKETKHIWFNYIKGVLVQILALVDENQFSSLKGFNAFFQGDLPLGLGLSSSAALEICSGLVFSNFFKVNLSKHDLAKIGQRSEHTYVGVKCGLLDQISSLYGAENCLVKIDFRSLEVENVPLGNDIAFLICDTKVHHSLVDSEYNEKRENCEKASIFFSKHLNHPVTHLRDVSMTELDQFESSMEKTPAKRARHIIGENERVLQAKKYLEEGNLEAFGKLMFQSHESSRVHFENSCPELDSIVECTKSIPHVYGARLSGGGFGGSAVALVQKQHTQAVIDTLAQKYQEKTGKECGIYLVLPSKGATLLQIPSN